MSPFSDDGHLHDLGLEWVLAGLVPEVEVAGHLAGCPACRERLAAAEGVEVPPARRPLRLPAPANRPRWGAALGVGGLVAAALALVWVAAPPRDENPDGLRVKGSPLRFEIFRQVDDGPAERLVGGDVVHAGDRLGFRVQTRDPGHLLVVGTDGESTYLCYPQGGGGRSAPLAATSGPVDLQEAVRMDAKLGQERVWAVLCEDPFGVDDLPEGLEGELPEGCVGHRVVLHKEPR